jgi:hypothetical protein
MIRRDHLPQTTTIQSALDDAQKLEPYTYRWSTKWDFPVPKDQVASRLGMDMAVLVGASKQNPENEELALLVGVIAHYAYNVDVDKSYDTAETAFAQAEKQVPGDVRAPWFHADFICQTDKPVAGAQEFLSVEGAHAWNELPAAFWQNYAACATVTDMPAHALRATGYMSKLNAGDAADRVFYADLARKSYGPVDLTKTYAAGDAWYGANLGANTRLTSTACGVSVTVHGAWPVDRAGIENGICNAVFSTGPYPAPRGSLSPEIVILVRRPDGDETLAQFLSRFTAKGTFSPVTPGRCPATGCLAVQGIQAGVYREDGDSHPHILVFERDEPRYPGLLFEQPTGPEASSGTSGVQYFRRETRLHRIPGKLFYVIALDTASSIEADAVKDYQFILDNLQVE